MKFFDSIKSISNEPRLERKYFLTFDYEFLIKSFIKLNPTGLKEIYYQRQVNNLYFDTPDLIFLKDNLIGSNLRFKFRIRWYGQDINKNKLIKPNLEVKFKQGNLIYKYISPLKKIKLIDVLNKIKIKKMVLASQFPSFIKEIIKDLNPTLMNAYKRRYFLTADKKIRLTVDKDIIFKPQFLTNNSLLKNPSDKIIIELKYKPENENQAVNLINYFPLSLQKNSKYVNGMATGLF